MQTVKMLSTKQFEQWLQQQSQIAVRYRKIEKSNLLAEYNTLKSVVESADFQSKKVKLTTTRYADTQEGCTMALYKQLKWNTSVVLYNLLKKESLKEKPEVVQYMALLEQIQTPEFQESNAFWKNPKRWFTTTESQQEKRYSELAKHEDIVFFFQHTEQEIAELESYSLVWTEECETAKLSNVWQTGFLYPSDDCKADHSHVVEQQAYTKGRNTKVSNCMWTILTKKEKVVCPAWHPAKGMIMHDFSYTSDVWHTTEAVAPVSGVLQSKIRVSGKAKHAFCLTTPKAQKSLSLLPANNQVKEAIYTLVWNEKEVINYVNNLEVSRYANPLAGQPLHLLVRSYLPENQKSGGGELNIDWIRIYNK